MEYWLEAGKVSQAAEGWITGGPHHAWLKDVLSRIRVHVQWPDSCLQCRLLPNLNLLDSDISSCKDVRF